MFKKRSKVAFYVNNPLGGSPIFQIIFVPTKSNRLRAEEGMNETLLIQIGVEELRQLINIEVKKGVELALNNRSREVEYLSAKEAAEYLKLTYSTFRKYRSEGRLSLPSYPLAGGRKLRFKRADLDTYLIHNS